MHNSYKSALALRILFYFLRSLYVYSSLYPTRDTHYRLIKYITFGVLLCVTHSDHLAIPTPLVYDKIMLFRLIYAYAIGLVSGLCFV